MKLLLSILIATLLQQGNPQSNSQAGSDSTPLKTVELFKKGIDENDMLVICKVMSDEEGTGPLKQASYEQMQSSLEGLSTMWRAKPFTYGETTYTGGNTATSATVKVEVKSLKQEVNFVLEKYGNSWYIFDIEIFFR
ncbi:MAG TPA: hypothetical protein VGB10_02145 [Bacteroidota bacterium]